MKRTDRECVPRATVRQRYRRTQEGGTFSALSQLARVWRQNVQQEFLMSVAKVIEISALSKKSFEDAITEGIKRAGKTVSNIEGAWIKDQKVQIKDGKIVGFRVNMNLTFVLDDLGLENPRRARQTER